jgi:serine/threonine protein kinase
LNVEFCYSGDSMALRQDPSVTPAAATAPEEFGPYLVYERLGIGGMATVHRAKKRGIAGFERGVALKRMLPHLAEDAAFINSFVREAKLASLLVHPNIAQIYDFGRVGATYYIAMEHVDGFDVRKMLRYSNRHKEPLPLPVVLSVVAELCDALDYAHTFVDEHGEAQGIVHRDVSPSNLIIAQSGHLKVIDFGIAKANVRQLHTENGRVKGKLGYMSPEVVTGRAFGPISDVFSAGVVAHELLTAHPLFSAKTDYDTLIRIHEAEIPPPSRRNPGVPAVLDEVVLTALARDPDRRLQSAREFREALDYVADQVGIRFSARDVADWRARIATTEDPWGSRNSQPSSGVPRAFPDSRSSLSGIHIRPEPPEPRGPGGTPNRPAHAERARAVLGTPVVEDERSIVDFTWGVDAAQASVHAVPDDAVPPTPAPTPRLSRAIASVPGVPAAAMIEAPTIGASITAQRPRTTGRIVTIGVAMIVGGLVLYLVALRPSKPPPAKPPALAAVKFVVQPKDALIEIGGRLAGRSSPFETRLDPGVYSVAVSRDGYKRWASEVTLREGDKQTVHIALEVGLARVNITSQPAGLPIELDGKRIDQVTPTELQVPSGAHTVVVTNSYGATWSQEFTAEVDAKLVFNAPLGSTKRPPGAALPTPGNVARPRTKPSERTSDPK